MKEKVDGPALLSMTDGDLEDKFRVKSLGKRKNLLRAVNYLKAYCTRAQNNGSSVAFGGIEGLAEARPNALSFNLSRN